METDASVSFKSICLKQTEIYVGTRKVSQSGRGRIAGVRGTSARWLSGWGVSMNEDNGDDGGGNSGGGERSERARVGRRGFLGGLGASAFVPLAAEGGVVALPGESDADPIEYVDPLIGTAISGVEEAVGSTMPYGNTFPGPTRPHGMVQLSPDTDFNIAGYKHGDGHIDCFSHTHLSGPGCFGLGNVGVQPVVGEFGPTEQEYRSRFRHDTETAEVGYYGVTLSDYDVDVELTATDRVGMHRYTFPETDEAHVLIDASHALTALLPRVEQDPSSARVRIRDDRTITGEVTLGDPFCGDAEPVTVYFAGTFDTPMEAYGTWGRTKAPGTTENDGRSVGAWGTFSTTDGQEVQLKLGVSYVSVENARQNVTTEIPHWEFGRVHAETRAIWREKLNRIRVSGGTAENRTKFYTALYHALLAPTTFSDVNGEYLGVDDRVHTADDHVQYTQFSLWDTWRAQHPLLCLLEPQVQRDAMRSLVTTASEGGWLPKWQFTNRYTDTMVGDHATSVLSESICKGIDGFDTGAAYEAMERNANETPPADSDFGGRGGLESYLDHGWVATESDVESEVTRTIEFAYNDWCLAQVEAELDRSSEYGADYVDRARNFRTQLDPDTNWYRRRSEDGTFDWWFHPQSWYGFAEGNAWTYTWFAPHDFGWLVDQLGEETVVDRLDEHFEAYAWPTHYLPYKHYWHANECSNQIPYMYAHVGQPWKTQERVQDIVREMCGTGPGGIPGNDDFGQMSAWFVFTALGFYPVAPTQGTYYIGSPVFESVEIDLPEYHYDGATVTIDVTGPDYDPTEYRYVQGVSIDGTPIDRAWFTHGEIEDGATVTVEMGSTPNTEWATDPDRRPPSMSDRSD